MLHWPYDEVTLRKGAKASELLVETPWIETVFHISDADLPRVDALVAAFAAQSIGPEHVQEVNWLFKSLSKFPLAYLLPRAELQSALDHPTLEDGSLLGKSPRELLAVATGDSDRAREIEAVSASLTPHWRWDVAAAIQFATSPEGVDPLALFSVARRYHLLDAIETKNTDKAYAYVRALKSDPRRYRDACVLMLRQNHYVTERCNASLGAALATAGHARAEVEEFIRAENGHDRILGLALESTAASAPSVPVTPQAVLLMDLLAYCGKRNFLAFAMAVDFFERSAYQESDPLAEVLREGKLDYAARQIDRHMKINDAGEHENVALSFLAPMGAVDAAYAEEALRLAELLTTMMNGVAAGVITLLEASDYFTESARRTASQPLGSNR